MYLGSPPVSASDGKADPIWQSLFQNLRQEYPYRRTMTKMRDQGLWDFTSAPTSSIEAYGEMMACIGAKMRTGSREDRRNVIALIREGTSLPSDISRSEEWSELRYHGGGGVGPIPTTSNGEPSGAGGALGKYATALQEYGVIRGFVPAYAVEILPTFPLQFKATVSCGTASFEGVDWGKKQARHRAAREACEHFKIRL